MNNSGQSQFGQSQLVSQLPRTAFPRTDVDLVYHMLLQQLVWDRKNNFHFILRGWLTFGFCHFQLRLSIQMQFNRHLKRYRPDHKGYLISTQAVTNLTSEPELTQFVIISVLKKSEDPSPFYVNPYQSSPIFHHYHVMKTTRVEDFIHNLSRFSNCISRWQVGNMLNGQIM